MKELLLKTKMASASTSLVIKNSRDSISSSSGKGSDCEEDLIKLGDINVENKKFIDISLTHDSDNEKPVKKLKTEHVNLYQHEINQKPVVTLQDKSNNHNNLDAADAARTTTTKSQSINLVEAKIIGLASTYLAIHPNGARLFDIWTYVNNLLPNLKLHEVHEILVRYGNLFEATGNKNNLSHSLTVLGEQNWKFAGFAEARAEASESKSALEQ